MARIIPPPPLSHSALLAAARRYASLFSDDPKTKVACFIFDEGGWLLGSGANRVKEGVRDVLTAHPELMHHPVKNILIEHAEVAALHDARQQRFIRKSGGQPVLAVVTYFPCEACMGRLLAAGVRQIFAPPPDFDHPRWGASWRAALYLAERVGALVDTNVVEVDAVSLPLLRRRPTAEEIDVYLQSVVDSEHRRGDGDPTYDVNAGIENAFAEFEKVTGIHAQLSDVDPDDPPAPPIHPAPERTQ